MSFPCVKCGVCCKNIAGIPQLAAFDTGNGVCKHLTKDNLCAIYERRPEICNVDLFYEKHLSDKMSLEAWYDANQNACEKLMRLHNGVFG